MAVGRHRRAPPTGFHADLWPRTFRNTPPRPVCMGRVSSSAGGVTRIVLVTLEGDLSQILIEIVCVVWGDAASGGPRENF